MRKVGFLALATMSVVCMGGQALADPCAFEMGAGSWIDTSGTADGLELWAHVNSSFENVVLTLSEGETSVPIHFAWMGTYEDWVEGDDLVPGSVVAHIAFDVPLLTGSVDGTSVGFSGAWFGYDQGWDLVWDDPVEFSFANGGRFALQLSDISLRNGVWTGPDGLFGTSCADVYASVTLLESPVVPEPATISIIGLGLAGLVLRRIRRA